MANSEQILDWNGEQGRGWVEHQAVLDRMIEAFGDAAMRSAAAQPGEQVLRHRLRLRQHLAGAGASGEAAGPRARCRCLAADARGGAQAAAAQRALHLGFVEADASSAALPAGHDLLYSRFGLMFFDDPAAALRHLRGALRPGARCAFVCWRAPRDNPWAMAPLMAVRQALGVTPPPADPLAPGPFAFADDQRLRALMAGAGFADIHLRRVDAPVRIGTTPRDAALNSLQLGPASRLARTAAPERSR